MPYVLITEDGWFLAKRRNSETDTLSRARLLPTVRAAKAACVRYGAGWDFCNLDDPVEVAALLGTPPISNRPAFREVGSRT